MGASERRKLRPTSSAVDGLGIRGSSSAIRLGVNAFVTSPRIRSCSGGSISMMYGIAGQPSWCEDLLDFGRKRLGLTTSALLPTEYVS